MRQLDWAPRAKEVMNFIQSNGRRPSQYKERKLHIWMTFLMNSGRVPKFIVWMNKNAPTRRWDSKGRKEEIVQFVLTNKIRPSSRGRSEEERSLAHALHNYTIPSRSNGVVYDPAFKRALDALVPPRLETKKGILFSLIKEFHDTNGHLPKRSNSHLANSRYYHTRTDERFRQWIPLITNTETT